MNLLGFIPAVLSTFMPPWAMSLLRVAFISIPVPLIVIVLAYGWWQIDKSSAVRSAVNTAIERFTGEAKKAALEAQLKSERLLTDSLRISLEMAKRRAAKDQEALEELQAAKRMQELEIQDMNDEIAEIMAARPANVPSVGVLGIVGRLRNR